LSDAVKLQKSGQIHLKSEYLIKFIGNIHKENFKNSDRFEPVGPWQVAWILFLKNPGHGPGFSLVSVQAFFSVV
jgi:hypothetical protein